MKEYLVHWYDYRENHYHTIKAENLKEARAEAFRMMCDYAGDSIYTVTVYEKKTVCDCQGEYNPHPLSAVRQGATRDYLTVRRVYKKGN